MKAETYRQRQATYQHMLPRLRSQAARRKLVTAFITLAVISAVCALLIPINNTFLLAVSFLLIVSAVLWTTIRITIDAEDMAPVDALDECQVERLESYRAFAFRLFYFFATLVAFVLIFGGMFWRPTPEHLLQPQTAATVLGYCLLIITLTVGGYPALALAWLKSDED